MSTKTMKTYRPLTNSQIVRLLKKAKAVISNPNRWVKGAFAENRKGEAVDPRRKTACKFCAVGAVRNVARGPYQSPDVCGALFQVLPKSYKNHGVATFNDAGKTSHRKVMALFDKAIARLTP